MNLRWLRRDFFPPDLEPTTADHTEASWRGSFDTTGGRTTAWVPSVQA